MKKNVNWLNFEGQRKLGPQLDVNIPVRGQVQKYITSDIVNERPVNSQSGFTAS